MFFDLGLDKNGAFFRIKSGGQIIKSRIVDCGLEFGSVIRNGHRVQVNNGKNAVVIRVILEFNPVFNRAQIIADVNRARRLYPRKHNFSFAGHDTLYYGNFSFRLQ